MRDINPREFLLTDNPFTPGTMAHALFGTPRDQWRWWHQAKRLERGGYATIKPEWGRISDVVLLDAVSA